MSLLADLRGAVGEQYVLTEPAALRAYETDGLTSYKAVATRRCPAWHRRRGRGSGSCLRAARHPVRRPRRRHRAVRRRGAGRRGRRHRPGADEPHPGGRRGEPPRSRPARASRTSRSRVLWPGTASTSPPTPPASRCARSVETWPRTPVARTASSTASRPTTCRRSSWCSGTAASSDLGEGDDLDLLGAVVGSGGTLGVVTEVVVRLLPRPEAVETLLCAFASMEQAGEAVTAIISAGIVPAAIEMMDALSIEAAEAAVGAGLPLGAGAALLVELDGPQEEVDAAHGRRRAEVPRGGRRRGAPGPRRDRAGGVLARPQGGVRCHGADQLALLRAGRRRAPDAAARHAAPDRRAVSRARPAGRQRLPRRRREPAPAGAVRRLRRGAVRACRDALGGDPASPASRPGDR